MQGDMQIWSAPFFNYVWGIEIHNQIFLTVSFLSGHSALVVWFSSPPFGMASLPCGARINLTRQDDYNSNFGYSTGTPLDNLAANRIHDYELAFITRKAKNEPGRLRGDVAKISEHEF